MDKFKCLRCGYQWIARTEQPKECPACKARSWNREKTEKKEEGK